MQKEINLLNLYPRSKRPIEERGKLVTEDHRAVARKFDQEYFDGDRLFGYGGYSYHPRFWQQTVNQFYDHYQLDETASILDVGCAKGYMLYDFNQLKPTLNISGIDISEYAIQNAEPSIQSYLQVGNAKELPYPDSFFDLVISINTIHNLELEACKSALTEIQRVSKRDAFITVDAWQ